MCQQACFDNCLISRLITLTPPRSALQGRRLGNVSPPCVGVSFEAFSPLCANPKSCSTQFVIWLCIEVDDYHDDYQFSVFYTICSVPSTFPGSPVISGRQVWMGVCLLVCLWAQFSEKQRGSKTPQSKLGRAYLGVDLFWEPSFQEANKHILVLALLKLRPLRFTTFSIY